MKFCGIRSTDGRTVMIDATSTVTRCSIRITSRHQEASHMQVVTEILHVLLGMRCLLEHYFEGCVSQWGRHVVDMGVKKTRKLFDGAKDADVHHTVQTQWELEYTASGDTVLR